MRSSVRGVHYTMQLIGVDRHAMMLGKRIAACPRPASGAANFMSTA